MKKIIMLFIINCTIIVLCINNLQAQTSVTAHASAEVIQALTATENATLSFGRFSPETAGGEIRLSPDGIRSSSGTVAMGTGLYAPASFNITGQPDFTVAINLPSAPVLLTNSTNGKTMQITKWESLPSASGTGVKIANSGLLTLRVGATLKIGNMTDNPVGIYNGTYVITFSYN